MFLTTIWTRSWRLPLVGVAVLAVVVVAVGGIYPALVQSLKVRPSEKSLEVPFIERNIEATRAAYGFDDVQVEPYDTTATASQGQLRDDAATIPGIRLIDPNVVSPTFKQLEASKGYYQFADVLDVDRYRINGELQDTVIAVRELDLTGVPDSNWLNDHTVYTHGYGVVAAKGNTREDDGRPTFFESQIGTTGVLGKYEPRIYFGESSPEYSIVGGGNKEFDYLAADNEQVRTTYAGKGGVPLDGLRRIAYAFKYRELNFLLSDAVSSDSRLVDHRTPRERVQRVAPWLTLDGNAYPVVVDDRVLWVLDGYTTTDMYPYSEMATLDAATSDSVTRTRDSVQAIRAGQINYVRNSVKATVDAYDGTVTLYQWDEEDPILKAWMGIFPETVKPMSAIKGSLGHERNWRHGCAALTPPSSVAARTTYIPWSSRTYGLTAQQRHHMAGDLTAPDRGSVFGRAVIEGRTIHVPDIVADPEYNRPQLQNFVAMRAMLGVPLMRDGVAARRIYITAQEAAAVQPTADRPCYDLRRSSRHSNRERSFIRGGAGADRGAQRSTETADGDGGRSEGHQPIDVRPAGCVRHAGGLGSPTLSCR